MFRPALASLVVAASCGLSSAQQNLWHIPVGQGQGPVRMELSGRYSWEDPQTGLRVFEDVNSAIRRREAEAMMQMRMQEEIRNQVEREMWFAQQRAGAPRAFAPAPAAPIGVPLHIKQPPINPKAKYPIMARMVGLVWENIPEGLSEKEVDELIEKIGRSWLDGMQFPVYYKHKKVYDPKLNPQLEQTTKTMRMMRR